MTEAKEHRTVTRVTTLLEAVAASSDGLRMVDLAAAIDAPFSSAHGLVQGLVANGYLGTTDGVYTLGPAIGTLVDTRKPELVAVARPIMEDLVQQVGETVALCSRVGGSVVYLDLVESSQPIRYVAPLRERRPMYPTSAGKCFLAFMSDRAQERHLAHVSGIERAQIRQELAVIRREGVAYNRGETVPDIAALAGPILVHDDVVACLNIAGPMDRVMAALPRTVPALQEALGRLASVLA